MKGLSECCSCLTGDEEETLPMGVALQLLQAGAGGDKLAGTEFDFTEMQARLQVPPDEPTTAGIKTHSFQTTGSRPAPDFQPP